LPPIETPDTQTPIPPPSQLPPIETPDTQTPPSIDTPTGFLLLKTNVINDNNGTKQASNFTIKILGTQASPSSFKAAQSPLAQLVEIGQGQYSTQVVGIEGYNTKFQNECTGFTILNNITVCTITLNDLSPTTPPPPTCPPGQRPAASQNLNQTTQQCVPDPEAPPIDNATGFLILRTDVINDNNGTKQASDFTINILGTQASPSSLKAAQSPLAQVIALKPGQYFVQIVGIEGYDTKFKHECAGFTILNSTKVCTITINDLPTTIPPPPPTGQDPVAKLVAPTQVQSGTNNVVLDASGSSNYDTITINQISGPTVTLNNIDTTKKQFTAPNIQTDTQLVFQVVAKKGDKTSTAQVTVLVSASETPPPPPPTGDSFVPFNFAAAGDWGCNSNTDKNVQSILSKESELALGLGDYSYESDADCWLETISPINDRMNISIGNHDSDEEEGPEITVQFLDHFNLDKQYYSFTKGNVFFLVMSAQTSYSENSEQFNFVKQELEKASKDPNIDWIVVYYHKPIYAASTKHAGLTSFRDIYHPLFDQYHVDLVLQGHNHNYQRTFPLQFNEADSDKPIIVNKNPNIYNEVGSPIFITAGTGGVSLHSLGAQPEFNAKQFGKFGHLNIDVSRDTSNKLVGTFYDLTGNKADEFTITKALGTSPPISSSSSTTIKTASQTDNPIVDKFGVKQIYLTKPGGEEWFMNMDDMKADPRFEMKGNIQDIKKNPDGSWSPIPGDKVRLVAYTSDSKGKFDENNMSTYNLRELSAKGHWYKENDWKNIEMGGYFKLNNADDLRMGYSFSSRSIDDSSNHGGCGGATPKFNIGFDGEIKAKKEMWHISLVDSPGVNDEDLSSIVGKWLGIKGVIYNLPGDKGVKQEFWIDKNSNGQWEKVYEFTDEGGFGERGNNGPEKCGGTWDQLYTWGSPKTVFKWDQSDVSFKFLSVREILPPA
ncbi:MAG TPA: metallophosphoesterase, partial [Nitrososphaeraceae archaeon]|nr:metallophosphoesterase [Nitrososphaeraceae archaeon]